MADSGFLGHAAVRMRVMPSRAVRISARIVFFLCGILSLLTTVPYGMMRGVDLPVASEWILFVIALGVVALFSVLVAVLPSSWIAKTFRRRPDDERLYSTPLKMLGCFAAIAYLISVGAYLAPNRWNLDPQIMLALCPMYIVKMTFDPSAAAVFILLAPMNAGVYGALGTVFGFIGFAVRKKD